MFNSVEEQVHGFLLLILNLGNVLCERIDILWLIDFDTVLLAFLDEILDSPLSLIAELYSCCIGQGESILVLVQVDEMRKVKISERLNDLPGVILRNCKTVQFHQFRSKNKREWVSIDRDKSSKS